jgi:hypothetical protein
VGEERVVLEDEANASLLGRQRYASLCVEPPLTVQSDTAAPWLGEAGDDAQS